MKKLLLALFLLVPFSASAQNFLPISTQPLTRTLNISASTVLKTGTGALICFNVVTAVGVGTVNDTTTTGAAAAANQIATIPNAVGNYCVTFPYFSGLVIIPNGSTVAVSYQ